MSDFLPREVREGLEAARKRALRKKTNMRIEVGGQRFHILRYWDEGFALDAEETPHLRGLADLYAGPKFMGQCLIVASAEEAGQMVFEFKRTATAHDSAPVDFARPDDAPVALLTGEA